MPQHTDAGQCLRGLQRPIPGMELPLKICPKIEISEFLSDRIQLGGIQSAFVSKLDEERKNLISRGAAHQPPVISIIPYHPRPAADRKYSGPGLVTSELVWRRHESSGWYGRADLGYFELTGEYIYKVYKRFPPMKTISLAIVGLSFRMDSAI